jgi:hypothetical protein
MEMLSRFIKCINSYMTETNGSQSSRRLVYFLVMTWCLGMFTGYIPFHGLDPAVTDIIKAVVYTAGTCILGGRGIEAWESSKLPSPPKEQP